MINYELRVNIISAVIDSMEGTTPPIKISGEGGPTSMCGMLRKRLDYTPDVTEARETVREMFNNGFLVVEHGILKIEDDMIKKEARRLLLRADHPSMESKPEDRGAIYRLMNQVAYFLFAKSGVMPSFG